MSETSRGTQGSGIPYTGASSPYDGRTEEITTVPRTEDDLGLAGLDVPTVGAAAVTERIPRSAAPVAAPVTAVVAPAPGEGGRGTIDLGLLILRVTLGAVMVVHGLQKLAGLWNGPGLDGFRDLLTTVGYERAEVLAPIGAVAEVAGGVLLIVGLATPLAGSTIVAVMINAWMVRQSAEPGLQFFAPAGVEYESTLVLLAAAIVLTGPGVVSLDRSRGWARRPAWGSAVILVVAVAASVTAWVLLNGSNPLS